MATASPADPQRQARRLQKAGHQVATERIGPEQPRPFPFLVLQRGGFQMLEQVLLVRADRIQIGADRDEEDDEQKYMRRRDTLVLPDHAEVAADSALRCRRFARVSHSPSRHVQNLIFGSATVYATSRMMLMTMIRQATKNVVAVTKG